MHTSPLNNPSRRTFLMQSAAALSLQEFIDKAKNGNGEAK